MSWLIAEQPKSICVWAISDLEFLGRTWILSDQKNASLQVPGAYIARLRHVFCNVAKYVAICGWSTFSACYDLREFCVPCDLCIHVK
jgi:hypothetical protein